MRLEERAAIRARHRAVPPTDIDCHPLVNAGFEVCELCQGPWPCDAALLLDELDQWDPLEPDGSVPGPYECMSCPIHGDGETPIDHGARCDNSCRDTHAYWFPAIPPARDFDTEAKARIRGELP